MKSILEVDSIILEFDHKRILSDCYLKCETGEIVGVLGRNGSGKSCLLQIIFGSLQSYNKSIRINREVYSNPCKNKNLIAYLPQSGFLPNNISIKKIVNLYIPDLIKKTNILKDEAVHQHLNKRITALSGGELRYLEILLLISLDVKFILLDEPFAKVEPLHIPKIIELINKP